STSGAGSCFENSITTGGGAASFRGGVGGAAWMAHACTKTLAARLPLKVHVSRILHLLSQIFWSYIDGEFRHPLDAQHIHDPDDGLVLRASVSSQQHTDVLG